MKNKQLTKLIIIAMIICAPIAQLVAIAVVDLKEIQQEFINLSTKARPSVIAVVSKGTVGSGFVIADGVVVTNEHVVRGDLKKAKIVVFGGRVRRVDKITVDKKSDLAIMRVDTTGLTPLLLADSSDIEVGQWAFAIGNPYGLGGDGKPCVSYGIVCGLDKSVSILNGAYYGNLIQTTVNINPGNSGGPLLDIGGLVIGINCATVGERTRNVGFALPIDARTRFIINKLSAGQTVKYGIVGVTTQSGFDGARILQVIKGSVADEIGLRRKDVIKTYRGYKVHNSRDFTEKVRATPVGEIVKIVVKRGKRELVMKIWTRERQ